MERIGKTRQLLQLSIFSKDPLLISLRDRMEGVNVTDRHRKHLEGIFVIGHPVPTEGLQEAFA
jgi:hypothetical protein